MAVDGSCTWGPDRVRITQLFLHALRRAGYSALFELPGSSHTELRSSVSAVLDGDIWSFGFSTQAATTLDVDLSLTLYDPHTSGVLWRAEFPREDALPFWIGLSCRPDAIFSSALSEVEAAALIQFTSHTFSQGVAQATGRISPSLDAEGAHAVVAASSWTGTDEGEITHTVHESAALEPDFGERADALHELGKPIRVS